MANPILDTLKLSGVTYDLKDNSALHDLDSTVTSGGTNAVKGSGIYNAITAATGALAETIAEELSGKTDESAFTAFTSATETALGNKADKSEIPSVSGYADSVAYDSGTTTMNFYHGGTGGTVVYSFDASPFLIDGMIDDVRIETLSGTTYLVIDFNTASGKEDIYIPLTDIFNPANYYTKTETDNAISAATSGKADSSDVQTLSGDVSTLSGDVSTINTNYVSGVSVNGTATTVTNHVAAINVKTINGTSIVGSGDITVQSLPTVSGTTLIFS